MMTESEKETLNFAAEAAGITIKWDGSADDKWPLKYENGSCRVWNPLHDDGDALRLAIKLKLGINFSSQGIGVDIWCDVPYGNDIFAATRFAIVRAAAEMAKG